MPGFSTNIEAATQTNSHFRHVLYTARHSQLVLMSLKPGEDIGLETHPDIDQFFRIESGVGEAIVDGTIHELRDGTALVIPAGSKHNIINKSATAPLQLYTLYSPPNHPDGTLHATKAAALAAEHS